MVIGSASVLVPNNTVYILTPDQLEQVIDEAVASFIWIGMYWSLKSSTMSYFTVITLVGELGANYGGFDRIAGESQVTQIITEWRLNVSVTILLARSLLM